MFNIAVITDPIECLFKETDTTLGIINILQKNNKIFYIDTTTIQINNHNVFGNVQELTLNLHNKKYFHLKNKKKINLNKMHCIFFRKDPPVDEHYIALTYMLDILEKQKTLIINSSQSLRDYNEKLLGGLLSTYKLPTIVSSNIDQMKKFINEHKNVVVKPLNMMRGENIQKISHNDNDYKKKIFSVQNYNEKCYVLIQKYLNIHKYGDKRIIIYNGIVYENALVRFPPKDDFRANLANGGKYQIKKIEKKYIPHLEDIASYLVSKRIYLAGIDMIHKFITEINITSPTGLMHLQQKDKNIFEKIAHQFISVITHYHDE